ncbi:hypothetical protein BD324DRAFT_27909 [Kockovaella imperatae]|uniref:DUF1772-domain-containing protein n=1 Tax=Kockovaella imperatae TaxID=4999 RepID=A0A1Y1USC2_9TREE|nr:hypothetical protein BD324DRAFT_27909 [Kockovaella imperatae]ORX40920.1 hypothetical protein BD324DRAFT_27909 [Kockovaella imperatae]
MPSSRLAVWHTAFNLGAKTIPPFAGAATALIIALAARRRVGSRGNSSKTWLFVAAAMQIVHVPFTLLAIAPTNAKLIAMRAAKNLDMDKVGMENLNLLLNKWCGLHNVRIATATTAFLMVVTSLLS